MLTVHNTASPWPRTCDTCRAAASAVYCRADLAYLCLGCDAEIHSANPLARRHHRVPIGNHSGGAMLPVIGRSGGEDDDCSGFFTVDEDELETASWLVDKGVFGEEVDEYLDLEEYSTSCENENWEMNCGYAKQAQQQNYSYGGDCVVPIQTQKGQMKKEGNEAENPPAAAVAASIMSETRHMEVGVVPEYYNSNSVISSSRAPKGTIDLFTGGTPVQAIGMDREARVLRYKEKKKNRKFEKTIRYASRKAYAETRPRIKGRFAKRRDDAPVDHHRMFPYGIIPSF